MYYVQDGEVGDVARLRFRSLFGVFGAMAALLARTCTTCKTEKFETEFSPYHLGGGSGRCLCNDCAADEQAHIISSLGGGDNDAVEPRFEEDPETCLLHCTAHKKEICDACKSDYTLPNRFQKKMNEVQRPLTKEEENTIRQAWLIQHGATKHSDSARFCTMDHLTCCPRASSSLKCTCSEGPTYCSKQCQKVHWAIHKYTCNAKGRTPTRESMSPEKVMEGMQKYLKATEGLLR